MNRSGGNTSFAMSYAKDIAIAELSAGKQIDVDRMLEIASKLDSFMSSADGENRSGQERREMKALSIALKSVGLYDKVVQAGIKKDKALRLFSRCGSDPAKVISVFSEALKEMDARKSNQST